MLQVYNTLSRKKEPFKSIRGKNIGFYLCGPTVYGPGHIGHARTYIAFDIIRRYLEYRGFKVNFVVNLTDIHDDIIRKANEEGVPFKQLTEKFIKIFMQDMNALHVKPATANPKVSEHIPEIIEMVKTLQEKGFAYETDDGVYYDISKFNDYGKLAHIKIKEQKTGTRVETDKYEKEKAMDFALWKKAKPGEPSWDSPWGKGRPGWHIECSAMSSKYLGEQFDVHAGAIDLIFPHHENEIAQSEAASGKKPFVKYWLHSGFLNVEGQKMSKSLGNYITIPEMLEKYKPEEFRFFVAQLHYKSRIDFSEKEMQKVKKTLEKLNLFIERLQELREGKENPKVKELIEVERKKFVAEMDNDFMLPNVWANLQNFITEINKLIDAGSFGKKNAVQVLGFLRELNEIFQVFSFERAEAKLSAEEKKLIEEREQARKEKNWKKADELRDKLKAKGILLDDSPQGTKWRKI